MKEDKSKKAVKQHTKVVDDKALDKVQGGMASFNYHFAHPAKKP